VEIPPPVRELALHPFRELPAPPEIELVETAGVRVGFSPWPGAQVVVPLALAPQDVPAAVEATRALARERGKSLLAWWIAPDDAALAEPLEAAGLANQDTPGFEAVEHAMALVEQPHGRGGEGVEVREVADYAEFVDTSVVLGDAFAFPQEMQDEAMAGLPQRWEEYLQHGSGRRYVALVDGEIVGTAFAAFGDAGVNLFGGCVAEKARGRGVYRALALGRWEAAVARGTPALTVQAGRMSKPIVERLGFVSVGDVRLYVDEFESQPPP
jgi:Acetyltransferase (GNAT) domain